MAEQMKTIDTNTLSVTQAEDFKVIYCNNSRITYTVGDIQISLGYLDYLTVPVGSNPTITDQAKLILSIPQSKLLSNILSKAIADYEKQFGIVNVPEQLLAPISLNPPLPPSKK